MNELFDPRNKCEKVCRMMRIHVTSQKTVMDGWVGAVMQKLLTGKKCYGRVDGPIQWTDHRASSRVACSWVKMNGFVITFPQKET